MFLYILLLIIILPYRNKILNIYRVITPWYNTTANLFKLSLKSEYKPETVNEDYLVEDILQRAYIEEKLEYQEPKLVKNYLVIVSKSRGYVDVSVYKEMFSKMRKKRKRKKK